MPNPSPSDILNALTAGGVRVKTVKGWNTRGRPWNYSGPGLVGVMLHHTSTSSATGPTGCPSLEWCCNWGGNYPFANAIISRDGILYLLSALSAWHSGKGGAWNSAGVPRDSGHYSTFGIEIDDPGVRKGTITPAQIATAAKTAAALQKLCKWPALTRVITHYNWTNGSGGVMTGYRGPQDALCEDGTPKKNVLPTIGRKVDTLESHDFWRKETAKYTSTVKPAVKPPVVKPAAPVKIVRFRKYQLTDLQIAYLAYSAGFRGESLVTAVAVALGESGGDSEQTSVNAITAEKPFETVDRGLMQINRYWHDEVSDSVAYNPWLSMVESYRISNKGTDWTPWKAFNIDDYAKFLPRAKAAAAAVEKGGKELLEVTVEGKASVSAPTAAAQLGITLARLITYNPKFGPSSVLAAGTKIRLPRGVRPARVFRGPR